MGVVRIIGCLALAACGGIILAAASIGIGNTLRLVVLP